MTGSLIHIPFPASELRLAPDGWQHGQPGYTRGLLVCDRGDGLAEVRLLVGRLTPEEARTIRRLLLEHGFTHLLIERHDVDGHARARVHDLRPRHARRKEPPCPSP